MKQCLLWIYMKNKNINSWSNKSMLIIFVLFYKLFLLDEPAYFYRFFSSAYGNDLTLFI